MKQFNRRASDMPQTTTTNRLDEPQQVVKEPVQVIAVTAGKGGDGKTNVSVNMAIALAKKGKRVMLLDADLGLANIDVLLGLHPTKNLQHVVSGECDLRDVIVEGPEGIMIVPSSSGIEEMTKLTKAEHVGIITAFNDLANDVDVLIVDTPAGIDDTVISFTRSAQEVMLVVCDEPTSITDAYAMLKVLSRDYDITRFNILSNMVESTGEGKQLFNKLNRVAEQFLDVQLHYMGAIPMDENLRRAVKKQQPFYTAYPSSDAAVNMRKIAEKVDALPRIYRNTGQTVFFIEQMFR